MDIHLARHHDSNVNDLHQRSLVSVVVPVLNESEVIDETYLQLCAVFDGAASHVDREFIFVDDGSTDDSYKKLRQIANNDPNVSVVKLSRNFGQQMAITAGIDHARGDAVVVIDSDLQDPPELIVEFIARWRKGYDVVYGRRTNRSGESLGKRLSAALFYRLLNRFAETPVPANVGDFRLMSRAVVDQFMRLRERDRFVRGLVSWIGFRQIAVDYERKPRKAGASKYPYRKMLKFAVDGMTSFSTAPLRFATILGYLTSLLAFLYLARVFVQSALGATVHGWASIMVALLLLGGVQLICIGIVGEYIGRIFDEVKARPMYIVEGIDNDARPPLVQLHEATSRSNTLEDPCLTDQGTCPKSHSRHS